MTAEYHALLSPSGSERWLSCANSLAAGRDQPDVRDKRDADLGTDKHELLAMCLQFDVPAETYFGHIMGRGYQVDREFAAHVQTVADGVAERITAYELAGASVTIEVEQDVPIGQITGEVGATGRADVVLIAIWPDGRGEQAVIDAKFGYREVEAENNPQGLMYVAGGLEKFGLMADFEKIVIVIHQPTLSTAPVEWSISVPDLESWIEDVARPAATKALAIHQSPEPLDPSNFNPGEKQCRYCRAAAVCPARKAKIESLIGLDFTEVTETLAARTDALSNEELGGIWPFLGFVEEWVKAVRARVEFELLQGREVQGTKLVEGRKGSRGWSSEEEAEALLKSFRLKQEQMYAFKLLGPKPILEELKDQPRRLKKIEAMIVQSNGKPHVAHVSDKRPALEIKPVEEDFDSLPPGADLV